MPYALMFALILGACVISFGLLWLGSRLDRASSNPPPGETGTPDRADAESSAGSSDFEINPATMLPMLGLTDMKGNLYMHDSDKDESLQDGHHMLGDQTDWNRPDISMDSDNGMDTDISMGSGFSMDSDSTWDR